ncbi:MAG TPA: glycosyltransferase family 2 protein [archaeon]|nr:glycosyltransferase family 2 protein [archaeon]
MEKVGIIILNWNTSTDTIECLESLKEQTVEDFKVYLIDNGSKIEDITNLGKFLQKKKTNYKIELIKNRENLGFTGGNNVGLKKATKHNFVFLLNNDTILEKKCIENLLLSFNSNSKIGAINPKIYYYQNKNIIWAAGANYSKILCKASLKGFNQKDNGQFDNACELSQLVGAAVMIKSTTLKDTGFFDEDYFCYYEETDLFHRMKNKGYKLFYEPKSIVYHKVAMSSGGSKNPKTIYYLVRNRAIFIRKNIKGLIRINGQISIAVEITLRLILACTKLNLKNVLAVINATKDIISHNIGKSN